MYNKKGVFNFTKGVYLFVGVLYRLYKHKVLIYSAFIRVRFVKTHCWHCVLKEELFSNHSNQ